MENTGIFQPGLNLGILIENTNGPVVLSDAVAVEVTGTGGRDRRWVSLDDKLTKQDEALETIVQSLNATINAISVWENYSE